MRQPWYSFHPSNEAKSTEVEIYGVIGGDWDGSGVDAEAFAKAWRAVPTDHEITLRIHSPGGSVWDGLAIYNMIRERKGRVTAHVDGIALSAASFIACAADKVVMPKTARMMIHDAQGFVVGDSDEMRQMAELLDKESDGIAEIYAVKTGNDADKMRQLMRATTWMDGSEAKEMGFADEVIDSEAKNMSDFADQLSRFRRVPGANGGNQPPPDTETTKERVTNMETKDTTKTAPKAEVQNPPPVTDKTPKAPDNTAEINQLRAALDRERTLRITAAYDALAKERGGLAENRDSYLQRCISDESQLEVFATWPKDSFGVPPVNHVVVGNTEPKEPETGREACELLGKLKDPNQVHNIYKRHAKAIKAHHFSSPRNANSFTTMTYTILAQEALQAFVYGMTPIRAFARNFSSAVVQDGDYVQVPFVASSDAALTFSGTYTMQDADATGKQVPIDTRKYVSWALTTEELATMPQLNMELFARQKGNALALAVLQDIWADITTANFGTDAITDLTGGDEITVTAANFDDTEVRYIGSACDLDNWPKMPRSLILTPAYYWGLLGDSNIIGDGGVRGNNPEGDARLPNLLGFDIYESNAVPANGQNLTGFAAHPDALLVAMRALVPEAGVANRPSVAVLTEPESGMTIVQREWFDADNDRTKRVLECNFGHLVGNPIGAKMIVSS